MAIFKQLQHSLAGGVIWRNVLFLETWILCTCGWMVLGNAFRRQWAICAGEVHGVHPKRVTTMWGFMAASLCLNTAWATRLLCPLPHVGLQDAPTLEPFPLWPGQLREQKPPSGCPGFGCPFVHAPEPLIHRPSSPCCPPCSRCLD